MEVLLGKGADPNKASTPTGGETPLQVAARKGHKVIVEVLTRHAAGN